MQKHEENVKAVCIFGNNNCNLIHHVKSNFCFAGATTAGDAVFARALVCCGCECVCVYD